jgi:hypothetical protein
MLDHGELHYSERPAQPDPLSPFLPTGEQYAWDSTSIKLSEECLRKYQYTMIEGWRHRAPSAHLRFGAAYATALEHYYKWRAEGINSADALRMAVREALVATWEYRKNEGCFDIPGTGGPWESDHNLKNRENLIRTIVWYVDQFEDEPIKVHTLMNGKPAVEYSFRLEIDNGNLLCGHIDRLVEYSGDIYVMDQKTTGSTLTPRYFEQFSPDTQMSAYTFAGKVIYDAPVKGVIIDAAQIAVGFSRFERGFTFRTQKQLEEWYDGAMYHIEAAQTAVRENHFPMRTMSCGNYGGCPFRGVCNKSPEHRENFLKADFEKRPWNPLATR